jgi:hypothetical protein
MLAKSSGVAAVLAVVLAAPAAAERYQEGNPQAW